MGEVHVGNVAVGIHLRLADSPSRSRNAIGASIRKVQVDQVSFSHRLGSDSHGATSRTRSPRPTPPGGVTPAALNMKLNGLTWSGYGLPTLRPWKRTTAGEVTLVRIIVGWENQLGRSTESPNA